MDRLPSLLLCVHGLKLRIGVGGTIYALDGTQNPQTTHMRVLSTHMIGNNDNLEHVGVDRLS